MNPYRFLVHAGKPILVEEIAHVCWVEVKIFKFSYQQLPISHIDFFCGGALLTELSGM